MTVTAFLQCFTVFHSIVSKCDMIVKFKRINVQKYACPDFTYKHFTKWGA